MTVVVLLVYFVFLGVILLDKYERSFMALLIGTIFFPCCALFTESPSISGQIVFLYVFLFRAIVFDTIDVKKTVFENPASKFVGFIAVGYVVTTIFNFSAQNAYYALRDMIDVYGYLIAAMFAMKKMSWQFVAKKLYWVIIFLCVYGLVEAATCTNLIYKYINLSFPGYDGWYNLNGSVCASEGWRMRTIVTTKHPTALGTLLTVLFLFYALSAKEKIISFYKTTLILGLLLANVYMSGSRTALFCIGVALLYGYMKNRGILMKFLCVGLLIFSSTYIVAYTVEHFLDNKEGSSIVLRMNQLLFSIDKIKESPIWGNGSNYTAHQIKDEGVRFDDDDEFIGGLESVLFVYLIDRGFLGLLTFYAFFIFLFLRLRKSQRFRKESCPETIVIGIVLFLSMSGLIGNNTAYCMLFLGILIRDECNSVNSDQENNLQKI